MAAVETFRLVDVVSCHLFPALDQARLQDLLDLPVERLDPGRVGWEGHGDALEEKFFFGKGVVTGTSDVVLLVQDLLQLRFPFNIPAVKIDLQILMVCETNTWSSSLIML